MKILGKGFTFFLILSLMSCSYGSDFIQNTKVPIYTYQVIKQYQHYPSSFTQGLFLEDDQQLYESAGLYGESKLIHYDLAKNKVVKTRALPPQYFAEGIASIGNLIYLLLYESKIILIFDKNSFQQLSSFEGPIEGWGLTTDGTNLIISDGSDKITYLNPKTYHIVRQILVKDGNQTITGLNALQYVNGVIYANIWQTDFIAIIDEKDGSVVGWINLTGLNPNPAVLNGDYLLNGITFRHQDATFIVTGKYWPYLYAIKLIKNKSQ